MPENGNMRIGTDLTGKKNKGIYNNNMLGLRFKKACMVLNDRGTMV